MTSLFFVTFRAILIYPPIPKFTFIELCRWLLRRRKRFRVVGHSMLPTLKNGDEVFVDLTAYQHQFPEVGDVVLAEHPLKKEFKILKRVTAVSPPNNIFLSGDNPAQSTDSRHYGAVPIACIYGRVSSLFI